MKKLKYQLGMMMADLDGSTVVVTNMMLTQKKLRCRKLSHSDISRVIPGCE